MQNERKIRAEWLAEFEAATRRPLEQRWKYAFIKTYKPGMRGSGRLIRWKTTANSAKSIFPNGWGITVFKYRQAEEENVRVFEQAPGYMHPGRCGGFPESKSFVYSHRARGGVAETLA